MLRGAQRDLDRDKVQMEREKKKLELEIKKAAKDGNKQACIILAKQLVQLRKQETRTLAASSKISGVKTQTTVHTHCLIYRLILGVFFMIDL